MTNKVNCAPNKGENVNQWIAINKSAKRSSLIKHHASQQKDTGNSSRFTPLSQEVDENEGDGMEGIQSSVDKGDMSLPTVYKKK